MSWKYMSFLYSLNVFQLGTISRRLCQSLVHCADVPSLQDPVPDVIHDLSHSYLFSCHKLLDFGSCPILAAIIHYLCWVVWIYNYDPNNNRFRGNRMPQIFITILDSLLSLESCSCQALL